MVDIVDKKQGPLDLMTMAIHMSAPVCFNIAYVMQGKYAVMTRTRLLQDLI